MPLCSWTDILFLQHHTSQIHNQYHIKGGYIVIQEEKTIPCLGLYRNIFKIFLKWGILEELKLFRDCHRSSEKVVVASGRSQRRWLLLCPSTRWQKSIRSHYVSEAGTEW